MVHDFDRPVNVTGYDPEDGSKVCWTVTCGLYYYHPHTGKTYLLVINQEIHFYNLEHHLMCTMKCRTNGIRITETPKYQSKAQYESTHAFLVEDLSSE